MSGIVRLAAAPDRDAALALYRALHDEHEAMDPRYRLAGDAAERWATSFRDWVREPRTDAVWLAETDAGEAVGLLTAHLYETAPTFRRHTLVWVDDLYVMPQARGVGFARRLLDAAGGWGRALGAVELRAGVLAANAGGRAFWSRAGATDFSVTVAVDLEAMR